MVWFVVSGFSLLQCVLQRVLCEGPKSVPLIKHGAQRVDVPVLYSIKALFRDSWLMSSCGELQVQPTWQQIGSVLSASLCHTVSMLQVRLGIHTAANVYATSNVCSGLVSYFIDLTVYKIG